MEIINLKLNEIHPYEKNPRNNDGAVDAVAASIKEFGFKVPIIIDNENIIVCGHTRYKAAKKLKLDTVPCIKADDLNEEQIKAFRLADNKVSELAEWDFPLLGEELEGITMDMEQFGFELFGDDEEQEEENKEVVEDEIPEVEDGEPITKPGDIYILGEHKLICGDSTKRETLEKLMGEEKADLVFTDPPYGMKKESKGVLNDNLNFDDLLAFNKKWCALSFERLKDNGSWYCWGIDEPLMDIYHEILKPLIKTQKATFRNLITWDKGHGQGQNSPEFRSYAIADEKCLFVMCGVQGFNNNSDNYFEGWEPVRKYLEQEAVRVGLNNAKLKEICGVASMYPRWFTKSQWALMTEDNYLKLQNYYKGEAFKREYDEIKREYDEIKREYYSTRAYFNNTHDNMNNVWHFERTSIQERELTGGHATPKPIALCARAIKSSSQENDIVLDFFGGSGSTLIACEQLNRKCRMIELDPKYCDVIVKRWEILSGKEARLINEASDSGN